MMAVTLAPETENRLRTMAEGFGLEPAVLHEDLLQQALTKAEIALNETLAGLDESVEAEDAWGNVARAGKLSAKKSEPAC